MLLVMAEASDPAAGCIRLIIHGGRVNRIITDAYLPGCQAVGWIVGKSPGSHANYIYSPGRDKLTEGQLYISTSCQPSSRVMRAVSDVGKPFTFSDLAVEAAKSENKKKLFFFNAREGSDWQPGK